MPNSATRGLLILGLVSVFSVYNCPPASAKHEGDLAVELTVFGAGLLLIPSIVNTTNWVKGERSSMFWLIAGGAVGALAVGATTYGAISTNTFDQPLVWTIFGFGALSLSSAIFAGLLPETPELSKAVSIAPLFLYDQQGKIAPGLGLRLLAF